MKRCVIVVIMIHYLFFISATDFENNFLGSYLDVEEFFLNLNGNYGTTFFPLLNRSYGGRDLGLNGASTAVADDISTLESNPAGTASLDTTEFFFSHSKLYGDINYNALAYTMRFNELGFGLGSKVMYFPFTHYNMLGDEEGSGIISYTVITMNSAYNFLRSYEHYGFSVGGNVKLYIYNVPDSIIEGESRVNVAFDLGILTRVNLLKFYKTMDKNFSIGLTVKNLGPFTDGDPPPTTCNFGLSYRPIEALLITTDLHYLIDYSEYTYYNWSFSTGAEYTFAHLLSIMGGVTIKSSPSFSVGVNLEFQDFKVSAVYTPDMTDATQFTISASIKFGDMGRKKKEEEITSLYSQALGLVNSSQYKEAETILNEILALSPNYTPAQRTIEVVTQHEALYKKVQDAIEESEKLFE